MKAENITGQDIGYGLIRKLKIIIFEFTKITFMRLHMNDYAGPWDYVDNL